MRCRANHRALTQTPCEQHTPRQVLRQGAKRATLATARPLRTHIGNNVRQGRETVRTTAAQQRTLAANSLDAGIAAGPCLCRLWWQVHLLPCPHHTVTAAPAAVHLRQPNSPAAVSEAGAACLPQICAPSQHTVSDEPQNAQLTLPLCSNPTAQLAWSLIHERCTCQAGGRLAHSTGAPVRLVIACAVLER